jgi:exopolyphosphatase / guanosine-5'-triphosphate,3'-diphosphate pyrophosphatase
MAKAAIDVGSNSLLLTVVDDAGATVHDEARVIGLGRGVGDRGVLRPDRMAAAEQALRDYVEIAGRFGVQPWEIQAAATSAARRAMNAETFFARIERETGLQVHIISGEEEAHLTWVGAQRDLVLGATQGPDTRLLVVDVGGGSTELVLGRPDRIELRVSLEVGSVRLTESHLSAKGEIPDLYEPSGLLSLRNQVHQALAAVKIDPQPDVVVGVAGTVTTLAAMSLGLRSYDRDRVHGSLLDRSALNRFVELLSRANAKERRLLAAVGPERADYLLAGALILDRVLTVARRAQLTVSDRGLRYGLLV